MKSRSTVRCRCPSPTDRHPSRLLWVRKPQTPRKPGATLTGSQDPSEFPSWPEAASVAARASPRAGIRIQRRGARTAEGEPVQQDGAPGNPGGEDRAAPGRGPGGFRRPAETATENSQRNSRGLDEGHGRSHFPTRDAAQDPGQSKPEPRSQGQECVGEPHDRQLSRRRCPIR